MAVRLFIEEMLTYLLDNLFVLAVLFVGCMGIGAMIGCLKKEQSRKKNFAWALFVCYVYMLFEITIFSREPGSIRVIHLIPFSTFHYKRLTVQNILLFLPFGFFYGVLTGEKVRKPGLCLLVGAGSSVLIELLQYYTARGGSEIDDVITNTLGMMLGFMLFKGWKWIGALLRNK